MTTSSPDVQSSPGPSQPDPKHDPICDRILFRLLPTPEDPGTAPRWFPNQVLKLAASSPTVQARINKLKANTEAKEVWEIRSKPEDGIHALQVLQVFSMVATETGSDPDNDSKPKEVAEVSQYCNVIWFYEVSPTRFQPFRKWTVIDGATDRPIGAYEMTPATFLHHVTTNGTHHSTLSPIIAGETSWCWRRSSSLSQYGSYKTAMHLANCAFILGRRDAFKRSIKPLIWENQPESLRLFTPVKYLRLVGPDGLQERRQQEKEQVLAHLLRDLTRYRKNDPTSVEKVLSALTHCGMELGDEPNNFTQPSAYELLREIESALLPRATTPTSPSPSELPPPPPPTTPEPSRRIDTGKATHSSHKSSSSSGSIHSTARPHHHQDTSRHNTDMTTSSNNSTRKNHGHKRQSGSYGNPNSSGSSLSSPPLPGNRPPGLPITPVFQKAGHAARYVGAAMASTFSGSSSRREPQPDPEPDHGLPTLPRRGETPKYDDFVHGLLQRLHEFVLRRQNLVAEDLLRRRDNDVKGWEARFTLYHE